MLPVAGRNFTANSKYLGTEVDVYLQWRIMPELTNILGGGYALMGDGGREKGWNRWHS